MLTMTAQGTALQNDLFAGWSFAPSWMQEAMKCLGLKSILPDAFGWAD
ncbi:hypothetical protein [Bradyrhizobium stylosanthis]|nr:hypothetical protein [Bradyrhizobium stylosanthis]